MTDQAAARALKSALRAASERLLMDATNPWELDEAMTRFGFSTGVCEAHDADGLDMTPEDRAMNAAGHDLPIVPRMVAEGRLGRKVGVGWYRYPGGGGLVIDPLVEDLLREEARFAGVARRTLSDEDLIERLVLSVINAAADLLPRLGRDGQLRLDRASIDGIGFPAVTGGIVTHARTRGQDNLLAAMARLSRSDGAHLHPSPHIGQMFEPP
ncbi:hypothetical protein KX928_16085 [Roseobacter sp. YSTF-M11]|uniref:3-hydroxyacyl-CoA dehydrogenase C-terminal domain-containing protein n=1 Tax=Roseobacter insulae TaxID=2859783 RepID=A0A9X1FX73_9RHOB|nr:3-hydroxyacyl-CoA dehydrogenase family protein [Roseobacter insulae]MBW4709312.1 hypothetical protein [Roseobacter insulae]